MIQVTPQMRVLVAVEPADFRCGIDGLARLCRARLAEDPFSGALFVFRNRKGTSVKALAYDGQGFWIFYKRLSAGRFRYWPTRAGEAVTALAAHELHVLLCAGDPSATQAAPVWRPVTPQAKAAAADVDRAKKTCVRDQSLLAKRHGDAAEISRP